MFLNRSVLKLNLLECKLMIWDRFANLAESRTLQIESRVICQVDRYLMEVGAVPVSHLKAKLRSENLVGVEKRRSSGTRVSTIPRAGCPHQTVAKCATEKHPPCGWRLCGRQSGP